MSLNIDLLCRAAAQDGVTDLFLRENQVPHVRMKGKIMELGDEAVSPEEMANFWKNCGADPNLVKDFDVSYTAADGTRFRVNLHRRVGKLGAALRPVRSVIPEMELLGLPEEVLVRWLGRSGGLILIAGPTGTGKSTTVASALQWMNHNLARHVVTIEDPIEFLFEDRNSIFTQREVGSDTESFNKGLRSSLRQSPDVIFLGEILESGPAAVALQAAETGHLVLSTLHSSNIGDTLERMADFFPAQEREPVFHVLSQQLIGVLCQKLLPGLNDDLVLVVEYVQNEGAVRNWLRNRDISKIEDFVARGGSPGTRSFLSSIVEAVREEKISVETGEEFCGNVVEYRRALRGVSGGNLSA